MRSSLNGIRRKYMSNQMITTEFNANEVSDEKEQNIIEWITLF